jgi:hypothetical protein
VQNVPAAAKIGKCEGNAMGDLRINDVMTFV